VEATDPLVREVLFNNYYTVAELYVDKGDLAQGQKYRALASGLAQKLLADHPTDPEVRRYVAFASFLAAKELAGREEWAAALEEVAKCEAAFRSLLEDGIATDRLKYDLALALFVKGRCHRNSAKEPEAWGAYEEARELLESLVREEPDHYGYSIELSRIETEMALVHMRRKTIDDNEAACSLLVSAGARLDGFADPERARNLAREIQPLRESIQRNRDVVNKRLTTTPSHTSRSDH
jgi:tetratricopeptide (TPR) repeat protein